MCAEDVEKLVNNRLQDLKTGGNVEDALLKEMDQANNRLQDLKTGGNNRLQDLKTGGNIEQAAPPK
ncbi:unnamed protein product [Prunus armeniaca]